MIFAFFLSDKCEIQKTVSKEETSDELAQGLLNETEEIDDEDFVETSEPKPTGRFSQISSSTRSTMYKLWFLLAVDSLADGMVSQTLTTYFLDQKFHLSKAALGDIMSTALILGTVSTVFAGPLCNYLGLLNTMVFTHLPSSAAVLLFPAPHGLVLTIILLYVRMGLNNMDQAPRAAFIAAIVKPEERTAVMGITSTLRTLSMTVGPSFTGALAGHKRFWIAFVVGGALRIIYDLGLWAMFINMRLHAHETNDREVDPPENRAADEEELRPQRREQEE
jgi:MFS family permease